MSITYGSVCSGIEAATQAWHPLGMRAAWFAEIEPFPSAVLAHHYPGVPNHGDMTKLAALVLAGKIPAPAPWARYTGPVNSVCRSLPAWKICPQPKSSPA
eukprot:gene2070-2357_t